MTRLLLRLALVVLTAAVFYNMFAPGGLRPTRPAHAFLGELPACGPGSK
jgi:hypothetical protein